MSKKPLSTRFAPAERAPEALLKRQSDHFSQDTITAQLLDSVPNILMVLNAQRQVVFANRHLLKLVGMDEEALVLGLRPGEVLGCELVEEAVDGCGTGEGCRTCGAVLAILASLEGEGQVRECSILRTSGLKTEALSLLVSATPLEFGGERFTIFAASDISQQKRRQALERIFYHDVLNVVGSIRGFAEILRDYEPEDRQEIYGLIHAAAQQTIGEIEGQRVLSAVESRDLEVRPEPLEAGRFLQQIVDIYRRHDAAKGRQLVLEAGGEEVVLHSDPTLLGRVLGNMLKNALEASGEGETVRAGWSEEGDGVSFRVANPGVIPMADQVQIFRRNFSTKGRDRGLGTYGMRLLSEYLGGKVSFSSSASGGTTFVASFPRSFQPAKDSSASKEEP
ncbi:MAG: histidine kinase [Desulfuromonas sp.]|uniref:PAS domain-containing sensor histidine kinase n=1 Tax=Desulfuromonas sp. TaxID=892 RepID=UPI000CB50DF4|nr:PAS domain-containing sensor histidine kinase [Desulfuromonas sp.]PLX85691.1 MAG: histidine kinase [Desulfuromonas sp.]